MLDYTIRPAVSGDLDSLWPMVRRAVAKMNAEGSDQWGPDYPLPEDYADDIRRGELIVAAAPDGRILGAACPTTAPEESYAAIDWTVPGPAMVIHRMVVDPEVQRSGIALALFQHAEALARAQGIPVIHVDTYSENQKMQGLFRKLGFERRGEIRLHFRDLPFPAFEKVL